MKEVALIAKSVGIDLGDFTSLEEPEDSSSDDHLGRGEGIPQVF